MASIELSVRCVSVMLSEPSLQAAALPLKWRAFEIYQWAWLLVSKLMTKPQNFNWAPFSTEEPAIMNVFYLHRVYSNLGGQRTSLFVGAKNYA